MSAALDVRMSGHAITRYRERVKPGLGREDAKADLERIARQGTILDKPPRYAYSELDSDAWLQIAEGIVLPLVRHGSIYLAVSCLCNGGLPEVRRKARNRRKAKRRADKHYKRSRIAA